MAVSGGYALAAGVCSLLVVPTAFFSWYSLGLSVDGFVLPTSLKPNFTLLSSGYGGWRVILPVLAGLVGVLAVAAWITVSRGRAIGSTWPWAIRLGAALVVLVTVVAMVARRPDLGPLGAAELAGLEQKTGVDFHFDLGWAAWLGGVLALGALAASFKISTRGT